MQVASDVIFHDWAQYRDGTRRLSRERKREQENWRRYDATEYGQWNETAIAQLIDEGRAPHTFNFSKRAIDVIVGSVIADTQDVHFETEYGDKNQDAISMETLYKEDRELGAYLAEFTEFVRAGFIYRGWMEVYKDRSRDPRGRVGLRYVSPDRITHDPDWSTRRLNDCKQLFITAWMTAEQIKDRWNKTSPEIEEAIKSREAALAPGSSSLQETDKVFDVSPESYDQQNGLFLVISKLWLKKVPRQKIFDVDKAETLPDMEGEDLEIFKQTSQILGRNIQIIEDTSIVCMVRTFCPALSYTLEIEKGEHPIQIGGYPMVTFSCDSINGRPNTPMDQLKDVQEALNKRESTITHILMTQSNNTLMVETDAIENPDNIQSLGKQTKRPGGVLEVNPDANRMGKIKYLDRGSPPHDFLNAANHMRDMKNDLTPAVPAIQATQETGESGVLYQARVAQAQVGMQISQKNLKAVWNDIGNAWFMSVRTIMTYPFVLSGPEGGFRFNMPGGIYIDQIPRMRVTITTSPTSETFRRGLLQQYIAINQYIPSELAKLKLGSYVVKQLPNVPDDALKDMEKIFDLEIQVQTAQRMVTLMTLNSQAQQMMAGPIPGMPGAPGAPSLPGSVSPVQSAPNAPSPMGKPEALPV